MLSSSICPLRKPMDRVPEMSLVRALASSRAWEKLIRFRRRLSSRIVPAGVRDRDWCPRQKSVTSSSFSRASTFLLTAAVVM